MTNKQLARIAGLFYLVVVLTGIFSLAYVPSKLVVWDNAATTFQNIASNPFLFRLGILGSVLCYLAFLFLPITLYKLLKPVNPAVAKLMVLLVWVSIPMSFSNIQNKFTVLSLVGKAPYLHDLPDGFLQAQAMLFLDHYENGILTAQVFWGLWLFPLGYLVYKSGILPRFLGVFLMLGCIGYLINFTGNTLLSDYSALGIASMVRLPATIGEIGTCLWLLLLGAKEYRDE